MIEPQRNKKSAMLILMIYGMEVLHTYTTYAAYTTYATYHTVRSRRLQPNFIPMNAVWTIYLVLISSTHSINAI